MRREKLVIKIAAVIALVAGGSALEARLAASAAPPPNGCPAGYQLMSVTALSAQGYRVPGEVDSPTSGVVGHGSGNGASWVQSPGDADGYVCAHALGNQTTPWGGQLYDFIDNLLPASS